MFSWGCSFTASRVACLEDALQVKMQVQVV